MQKKFDVLVAGELNMDLILNGMEQFPEMNKEIISHHLSLTLGSSSAIFASNLSSLGSKVAFIGKIGADEFGGQVIQALAQKKINTDSIIHSQTAGTGLTVALSYQNERAMVTYPGAMNEFSEKDIPDPLLSQVRHLHVSSIFLQPKLKEGLVLLFQRAKDLGLTTSLDVQWDPDEKWDCDWEQLLPHVDLFLPNKAEILHITRQREVADALREVHPFSHTVVVKDGENGSIRLENGEIFHQSSFLNPQIKDTIGAGDSFDAGFVHYFLKGKTLRECMEFGSLCGAINTTSFGGTTAFSNKEKIKEIAQNQFKYSIHDL